MGGNTKEKKRKTPPTPLELSILGGTCSVGERGKGVLEKGGSGEHSARLSGRKKRFEKRE